VNESPRSRRETFWERIWASTIIIYSFVATFVVWKALHKYGVNPYLFFVIDVITSWLYGLASARLVMSLVKKRTNQIAKWGIYSALNFVIPQVYILVSAHDVPREVYLIIGVVICVLAIFSLIGIYNELRKARAKLE
jgi:hypothetical protein